ncbi:MAG: GntR family transcriptional regulator [Lautropia sp.]
MTTRTAPLYLSVADAITRSIERGDHPVGSLLPPETELCQRFGVSRHTIRAASRRLTDLGLIHARAGIGTIVRASSASPRYTASLGSLTDLLAFTQATRLEILSTDDIRAGEALAATLRCRRGQAWHRLRTLRYPVDEAQPLSHTEIHVRPAFRDLERHFGNGTVTIFSLIEQHYGEVVAEVLQDIGACSVSAPIARLLGVKPRTAGLSVHRHYLDARGKPLAISLNTFAEGRFRLETRWRLGWQADPLPAGSRRKRMPAPQR